MYIGIGGGGGGESMVLGCRWQLTPTTIVPFTVVAVVITDNLVLTHKLGYLSKWLPQL
jgi:hypothetical protein